MILKILTYPDPKLKEASTDVEVFDNELHTLLDDMYETMLANNGIGLAAIQVGVTKNVLIINIPNENDEQSKEDLIEAINPRILEKDGETLYQEGCLSVPEYYEEVKRAEEVLIEYYTRDGERLEKRYNGLYAIAFQHEMDHLKGHLFIEKLNLTKRQKFEKEWKKRLRAKKKL